MENEIMNNGEIIEATEEVATSGLGKGTKVALGVATGAIVGFALYKGIKWLVGKARAKKEQEQAENEEVIYADADDDSE